MLKVKLQIECKSEASVVWMATKQGCKILERLASNCNDKTKVSMKDYFLGERLSKFCPNQLNKKDFCKKCKLENIAETQLDTRQIPS